MFRDRSSTLIRLGILALPAAGLLGLVGLLSRYSVPNPRVDPEAAARFASSSHYFASQFAGNVVGLTLLIFGILALTAFLSETRVRGLALAAMILSIAGIAPILSALGVTTYALPVLGRAYLGGQSDALVIVHTIFHNPLRVIFVPAFLLLRSGIHPLLCSHLALGGSAQGGGDLPGPPRPSSLHLRPAATEPGRGPGGFAFHPWEHPDRSRRPSGNFEREPERGG